MYTSASLLAGGGVYAGVLANFSEAPTPTQQVWGVTASVVTAVLTFFGARAGQFGTEVDEGSVETTEPPQRAWNVPRPTERFVGQNDHLDWLKSDWLNPDIQPPFSAKAVTGMPGVGKSQLAARFAHLHRVSFNVAWIVRAEHIQTLREDLRNLGIALGIVSSSDPEDAATVRILQWLNTHSGWLLIYDNCPNPNSIDELYPQQLPGLMIITTRYPDWGNFAQARMIVPLPRADALAILHQVEGGVAATSEASIGRVVDAMAGLPLALEQARAYVDEVGIDYSTYLELIERIDSQVPAPVDAADIVTRTMAVALTAVTQRSTTAKAVLQHVAFLAPDDIPLKLLRDWQLSSTEAIDGDIYILRQFSLLNRKDAFISCHRVMQATIRRTVGTIEDRTEFAASVLTAIEQVWPDNPRNVDQWPWANALAPHFESACRQARIHLGIAATLATFHKLADMMLVQRRAFAAREYAKSGVAQCETTSEAPLELATLYADLGDAYRGTSSFDDAVQWHKRALNLRLQVLGENHPLVANAYELLGNDYVENDDALVAAQFHGKSVRVRAATFDGSKIDEFASALNGWGNALRDCGEFERARQVYLRALTVRLAKEPRSSLGVLTILNGLAHAYTGLAKYQLAVRAHRRVLQELERQLGPHHVRLAEVLHGLAEAHYKLGQAIEAVRTERRARNIYMSELGDHHTRTAAAMRALDRYKQASY